MQLCDDFGYVCVAAVVYLRFCDGTLHYSVLILLLHVSNSTVMVVAVLCYNCCTLKTVLLHGVMLNCKGPAPPPLLCTYLY